MKRIITTMFVAVMFFGTSASQVSHVSAQVVCGDPAFNNASSSVTYTNCGGGNPENVMTAWGKNSDVPHIKQGDTVKDEALIEYTCPWFYPQNCVDITRTAYYRNAMIETGRQLKNLGYVGGMFGYWMNLAK